MKSETPLNKKFELRYSREVACAMIEQAMEDVHSHRVFKSKTLNDLQEVYRSSAITFFRSRFFEFMCDAMQLNADAIRFRAFR